MSERYKTEQEAFWADAFGDAYVERNREVGWSIASRTALFARVLSRTRDVSSVLELGSNIGNNLLAIRNLIPDAVFAAVEINANAVETLQRIPNTRAVRGSILEVDPLELGSYDLTMISGVLIHVDPDHLSDAYRRLYECSTKYILVIEYYNPTPVEVTYRGHERRLFKRDFAGEILDTYPDVELVDYGFQYHRDANFPADDHNWFLMKKTTA